MNAINRKFERNHLASLLALQCLLRVGGLIGIGALSAVRKTLDTYLLCLQHGANYMNQINTADSPENLAAGCVDAVAECVEKSWQDFRNNLQIVLLTQDEALIWVARIDKALLDK